MDQFFSNSHTLGAAAVALAGLISATRITKTRLADNKYLFFGAGAVSPDAFTTIE